jgi:hypothetical protein
MEYRDLTAETQQMTALVEFQSFQTFQSFKMFETTTHPKRRTARSWKNSDFEILISDLCELRASVNSVPLW